MNIKKILSFLVIALFSFFLVSCKEKESEPKWTYVRPDNLPDFATKVTLNTSNLDSDFDVTGRGYVTIDTFIDGDTVHFLNNSKTKKLKTRFIAIDTPESTGKVEPWGKPASIYTKQKLMSAEKIVLESNEEGSPTFDSTGERYLAWVWYLPKGSSTWRNLNIEILQDGLAMGKNSSSNRYGATAVEALTDARTNKLNMYSRQNDPLFFYGETVELTIKALVTNKQSYSGIKVRFEGVVTKEDGNAVYVESFDKDTNQSYGVYVYGGYASLAPKFLKVGYKLRITGTADNNETFGFQVSGLSFSTIDPGINDVKILERDVNVEPSVISGMTLNENESLENTLVKLENLKVTSVYTTKNEDSSNKGAMTLTCTAPDGQTVTVRTAVLTMNGNLVTESYFKNHTITVVGIVDIYEGKPQVRLLTVADVTIIK